MRQPPSGPGGVATASHDGAGGQMASSTYCFVLEPACASCGVAAALQSPITIESALTRKTKIFDLVLRKDLQEAAEKTEVQNQILCVLCFLLLDPLILTALRSSRCVARPKTLQLSQSRREEPARPNAKRFTGGRRENGGAESNPLCSLFPPVRSAHFDGT
jgi:hypothetical protein